MTTPQAIAEAQESWFSQLLRDQIRRHFSFVDEADPGTWVLQSAVARVLAIERHARLTDPEVLLEHVLQAFQRDSRTTSDYYGHGVGPCFIACAELDREGALRFMRNVIAFEMEGRKPAKSWTE